MISLPGDQHSYFRQAMYSPKPSSSPAYLNRLQVPILALSMILVSINVNIPLPEEVRSLPLRTKLGRIDFLGSLTLVLTVGCLLFGLSLKSTEELPWSHPLIWGLISASGIWGIIFVVVETRVATYPVMPIRLIKQRTPLAVSFANFFACAAAFSMLYNVPLVRNRDQFTLLLLKWPPSL